MASPSIDIADVLAFFSPAKEKDKSRYWFYNVEIDDKTLQSKTYSAPLAQIQPRAHTMHKPIETQDTTRLPSYNISMKRQKSQQASSPFDFRASLDPPTEWPVVSVFDQTTLQTREIKKGVVSSDITFVGTSKIINQQLLGIRSHHSTPIINAATKTPSDIYGDPVIQSIAAQPTDHSLRVFSTANCLAAVATCSRSLLPFDLVFEKRGTDVYVSTRTTDSPAVIETNLESATTTYQVQHGEMTEEFFQNAAESTQVNANYIQTLTNAQKEVAFQESAESQAYVYRRIHVNEIEFIVRCEIDALSEPVAEGQRPQIALCRTFNEVQVLYHSSDWANELSSKRGSIFTSEVSDNVSKVARWVALAKIMDAQKCFIGFSTRKNSSSAKSHLLLGTEIFTAKRLASVTNLSDANMMGIIHLVFSKLEKTENGKFAFVREGKKNTFRLFDMKSK